jgi:hypothetical protein
MKGVLVVLSEVAEALGGPTDLGLGEACVVIAELVVAAGLANYCHAPPDDCYYLVDSPDKSCPACRLAAALARAIGAP